MNFGIAIHGGAGAIVPLSPEKEQQYMAALNVALNTGYDVLQKNGSALDAVEAAVLYMEDSPLFNAGKASVFNNKGWHEMDAGIMWGKDLTAGAVAMVRNIKNPVLLARKIMEKSECVFLCGDGAEEFAREMNLKFEDASYFFDQYRYDQWLSLQGKNESRLDHNVQVNQNPDKKFGTVGAVALDNDGNLASATSTGGMTNKKFSRIGDTPIIGAGTYANNNTCAVSCTGHGEYFIRSVAAYDISCLMEYKGLSLAQACAQVMQKISNLGGEGGLIAMDKHGNMEFTFNSAGMFRAMKDSRGKNHVGIYK